jgi:hypothetical protein
MATTWRSKGGTISYSFPLLRCVSGGDSRGSGGFSSDGQRENLEKENKNRECAALRSISAKEAEKKKDSNKRKGRGGADRSWAPPFRMNVNARFLLFLAG